MNNIFKGKTILVTGGTGSIGGEIVRQLLEKKPKIIKIYAREEYRHWLLERELEEKYPHNIFQHIIGDIRDSERLNCALRGVDIVFHAAGLKHVPYAEQNPEEAISINVFGSKCLLESAIYNNVKRVVAISTDKAVYPTTIMGITKLLMERLYIADRVSHNIQTKFSVVRFGNIMNSMGSVIPRWTEQIKTGKPISVTDKRMWRFFMSVDDAVKLTFYACQIMQGREIVIFKMPEMNIYELAQKVIKEHGGGKKINTVFTGMREREKLHEHLFTEEEKEFLIEKNKFFIVLPNKQLFNERQKTYV